ncbi:hypothetical protein KAM345_026310 [Aeromonas caviae]|nr:hypothetical protein KAM345_026310 [Aeromonas caviae]
MGVAFLLVTFLWPRKEKSLAKPRSGGETPSRAESSRPARRSRAIEAWGGIRQAMPLPTPHPDPLPQGERGQSRNPIEGSALVSCTAKPCHGGVGRHCTRQCRYPPLTLALSRKGGGDQAEVSEVGGRNPVEGRALVSCTAKPCH